MKLKLLTAVCVLLAQVGCSSHLYNISSEAHNPVIAEPLRGEIITSDAKNARILQRSGIVITEKGNRIVILNSLHSYPKCGMPYFAAMFTLGLLPATTPEKMEATLISGTPEKNTKASYELRLEERYSLWESFNFIHDDNTALARALAWSYQNKDTTK